MRVQATRSFRHVSMRMNQVGPATTSAYPPTIHDDNDLQP
jgi:hypothetical protein